MSRRTRFVNRQPIPPSTLPQTPAQARSKSQRGNHLVSSQPETRPAQNLETRQPEVYVSPDTSREELARLQFLSEARRLIDPSTPIVRAPANWNPPTPQIKEPPRYLPREESVDRVPDSDLRSFLRAGYDSPDPVEIPADLPRTIFDREQEIFAEQSRPKIAYTRTRPAERTSNQNPDPDPDDPELRLVSGIEDIPATVPTETPASSTLSTVPPTVLTSRMVSTSSDLPGGVVSSQEAADRLVDRARLTLAEQRAAKGEPQPAAPIYSRGEYVPSRTLADPIGNTRDGFADDAWQLRLDLGEANAPMKIEDVRAFNERKRLLEQSQSQPAPKPTVQIATPKGTIVVERDTFKPVYRYDTANLPSNIDIEQVPSDLSPAEAIAAASRTAYRYMTGIEPGDYTHFSKSALEMVVPERAQELNTQLDLNRVPDFAKALATPGILAGDLAAHGTVSKVFWRLHPGDVMQTYTLPWMATKISGIAQSGPEFKRYGLPVMALSAAAMHAGSGNLNLGKLFNTEEGPRPDGFRAQYYRSDDPTKTRNYPLATVQQLLPGTSTYLLPWEEFKEERPDVSYDRYKAYQDYLRGEGGFRTLGGVVKATADSVDAPDDAAWYDPRQYEARIAGYKITPLGAAAGLGVAALGFSTIGRAVNRRRMAALAAQGFNPQQIETVMKNTPRPTYQHVIAN